MTENSDSFKVPNQEFISSRQINLFKNLKQQQFTGRLILTSSDNQKWSFSMYLGRIIYATGGNHPVRRWRRNIITHAPDLINQISLLTRDIFDGQDFYKCWEYDLLRLWLEKDQISRQQISQIIRGIIVEIFFDLTQTAEITYELNPSISVTKQLIFFDADSIIVESWKQWQNWQGAKLADRSPNKSPIIRQRKELKQNISPKSYNIMKKLFNGKNSLRDLSVQLQQNIVLMTQLMIPYIELGWIDLISIHDLPLPWSHLSKKCKLSADKSTIVCVSDHFHLTEQIKQLIIPQGYNFISFNHAKAALISMLANPPQFIFLDFDLQNTDIHEFAMDIQKLPKFRNVPIVIMTDNINLKKRIFNTVTRGISFLSKPIDNEVVSNLVQKHLSQLDKKNK